MKILHCFADEGIESEALAPYGEITRVGLDPQDTPYTDTIVAVDLSEIEIGELFTTQFDLGLFHPPCQPWTPGACMNGTRENHDNLIPVAREIAERYCDEWIIENVPNAPLHDPVVLNGGMFGSPLHYERAFETSYHVDQPRNQARLCNGGPFDEHHDTGGWQGSEALWRTAKGYSGDYNVRSLKREAIPRTYLNYLLRPILN